MFDSNISEAIDPRELRDCCGRFATGVNVITTRTAEGDHGIGTCHREHTLDRQRQFPGTRDVDDVDHLHVHPVAHQAVHRALDQAIYHMVIEAAHDDHVAALDVDEAAFDLGNRLHLESS